MLLSKINHENTKLEDEVNKILTDLKKTPKDIEEMHELRTFAKVKLPEILIEINQKIASIMNKMTLLDEMGQKLSPEDFAKCWASFGHPLRLFKRKEKCLGAMGNKERVFIDDLMKQQGELALEIQNLRNDLEILMKAGDMENYEKISNDFLDIGERINNSTKEGEIINRREEILNYKQSDYVEIEKIRKTYLPYNQVWSLARDSHFKLYTHLNSNLNTLERDTVTSEVLESWKDLFKKEKTTFKLVPHMLKVTTAVRKEFEKFKPYLPLINDLRNPALKQRHWTQLAVIMKIEGEETATSLKLQDLLDKGIMDIKDQIRDISEIASKEYSFEKVLIFIDLCILVFLLNRY